jgi:UDP-N-acetylglucosamine:LPS N-acetylglucosamine transferase
VAELATPGSEALATMRAAVKAAARPDATRRIAELITSMAGRPA